MSSPRWMPVSCNRKISASRTGRSRKRKRRRVMRLIKLVAAFALVALVQFYLCAAAGTLIDGTGRPAVEDAAIVIRDGRFQEVGRRGQVRLPQGAEVIDAKGKTIL